MLFYSPLSLKNFKETNGVTCKYTPNRDVNNANEIKIKCRNRDVGVEKRFVLTKNPLFRIASVWTLNNTISGASQTANGNVIVVKVVVK